MTALKSWYKDEQIADSFDNAMKIGMEGLRTLSGEEC